MKINKRPVIAGLLREGVCALCDKAWRLHSRATKLIKRGMKKPEDAKNKQRLRKADWLRIVAAKTLWKDWKNHFDNPRCNNLYISSGRSRELGNIKCWNCKHRFRLDVTEWNENPICIYCLAPPHYDWFTGKVTRKEAIKWALERTKIPYAAIGAWRTLRWSKEKHDTVPRRRGNDGKR